MTKQTERLIHQTLEKHRDQLETLPEITASQTRPAGATATRKAGSSSTTTSQPSPPASRIHNHPRSRPPHPLPPPERLPPQTRIHHPRPPPTRETTTKIPRHPHKNPVHKIEGGGVTPSVHEKRPSRRKEPRKPQTRPRSHQKEYPCTPKTRPKQHTSHPKNPTERLS